MKRIIKKITVILLLMSLLAGSVSVNASAKKYATITVEKITIGQGFVVEPTKVEIEDGDTIRTIFERVSKEKGIEYTADMTYGFYLTGIKNADNGSVDIPSEISKLPSYDTGYGLVYSAPSNELNTGNVDANLDAYDYNDMSGWLIMCNNQGIAVSADDAYVNDNDVIRVRFSLYGWGADIGIGSPEYTNIPNITQANKDALIKMVAEAKEKFDFDDERQKSSFEKAIKVLEKYNATAEEINESIEELLQYKKIDVGSITPIKPATKNTNKMVAQKQIKIAKPKIKLKKIKKRRVKIIAGKVKVATKYEFRYATNKKFKKQTIKKTSKRTIITRKFKKNQKCFAKVRAFTKVNGKNKYGVFSKTKNIKIR